MVLSHVRLIRVGLVLVNLNPINYTYITYQKPKTILNPEMAQKKKALAVWRQN